MVVFKTFLRPLFLPQFLFHVKERYLRGGLVYWNGKNNKLFVLFSTAPNSTRTYKAMLKGEYSILRPPATVSYAFEKELINRQNRYIRLYDSFQPNLKRIPIAIKFWSKYDSTSAGRSGMTNFDYYCALVEKKIAEGPQERNLEPITESQSYGWYYEPFYHFKEEDINLLYHPKKRSEITIAGEKINADRITQRPRFTGVPFKLTS